MALAETAKLAIELNLTGNAAAGIKGVETRLAGLNKQSGQISQGFRTMGAGVGVAAKNILLLGTAVAGGLVAGLIKSVKEGQEAAKVQTIYATAVQNSGKVSTQYIDILAKQRTALMNLAGIDDELIQTTQTRLIQMGATGEQVAKLTPLILDFATAQGIDLETATKLVGKSIQGNVGALSRYGVMIDKAKAKVDPFAATQEALNKKFGGTTQALSGTLDSRLGAFRENLANIREEAGMKLLPALTRIVDVAGTKLVPAFGKFVDRILPSIISGLDTFASMLENGGAERGIQAITDALGPMVEMLKIAAAPVKAIVSAFLSLPSQVQGVLIGAFAVNKLSGGLIAQGAGQVLKGAIGGIAGGLLQRGGTPATPLFVSDVSGGLGKGLTGGAAGGLGLFSKVFLVGEAIGLAALVLSVKNGISDGNTATSKAITATTKEWLAQSPNKNDLVNGLRGVEQGIRDLQLTDPQGLTTGDSLAELRAIRALIQAQLTDQRTPNPDRVQPVRIETSGLGGRNLMSTFSTDAIRLRAIAAGFKGTDRAVQNTLQRNQERLARAQREATAKTTAAVNALPAKLAAVLPRGFGSGSLPSNSPNPDRGSTPKGGTGKTPEIRNGFVVNANVTVPIKDVSNAQGTRKRWGKTAVEAGAA